MNHRSEHACGCNSSKNNFNAEVAFHELAERHEMLVEQIAAYMNEAGLERADRIRTAKDRADTTMSIIGGYTAPPGQFPECCMVGTIYTNGQINWKCTGVLVHRQIVLTAAHCSPSNEPANIVALNAISVTNLTGAEVINAFPVPYTPYVLGGENDISVLLLQKPSSIPHVPIATPMELSGASTVLLVGFGINNLGSMSGAGILRYLETKIVSLRRSPVDPLSVDEMKYGYKSDREFVAGGGLLGSCKGDSGGPAYINTPTGRRVAGLTSRRVKPTPTSPLCGEGSIYTRVDAYIPFIKQAAAKAHIVFP